MDSHRARDVLVTGVPRGGTTLVGALLDSLPDTLCLSEPPWHWHRSTGGKLDIGPDPTGQVFAKWLVGDFVDLRRRLLAGEVVLDRRESNNRPVTNYHAAGHDEQTQATPKLTLRPVIASRLEEGFMLAVKHNGPYLTALKALVELDHFTIVAVVRHPVDVIHSWQSLNLPVSRGKMHDAARCWPEMAEATGHGDLLERQVRIYDLICQRLHEYRDHLTILRYEDVLADPTLVSQSVGHPKAPDRETVGLPTRRVNTRQRMEIEDALIKFGRHFKRFYPNLTSTD